MDQLRNFDNGTTSESFFLVGIWTKLGVRNDFENCRFGLQKKELRRFKGGEIIVIYRFPI